MTTPFTAHESAQIAELQQRVLWLESQLAAERRLGARGQAALEFDCERNAFDSPRGESLAASGWGVGEAPLSVEADVDRRKRAEQSLAESERRFRMLAVNSPMGIFQTDAQGNILFANDRYATITGVSADEMGDRGWLGTVHPEDHDEVLAAWQGALESRCEFTLEYRCLHGDGTICWVMGNAVPLQSETGQVVSYLGNVLDITQRKQTEDALRASEQRFRLLSSCSPLGVFLSDETGLIMYANPRLQAISGFEPEDLTGRGFTRVIHPHDREKALQNWSQIARTTIPHNVERRFINSNGETRWVQIRSVPLISPSGTVDGRVGTVEDVTERRQAAEQLRDSEARMRGILDTAGDGIITIDESGVIELFNQGAERLFGYRADEVLGHDFRLLMPGGYPLDQYEKARERLARMQLPRTREMLLQRRDGTLCELEVRVGKTVIAGRTIFTGILHDITERKRTEKMLRESEKLAATGRIAARIAHEINNPLAGIKNSFLLIKDAIPAEHAYFSYVERIDSEIDRIARIVRQMFDLYRPDHVTLREIRLDDTIRDIVALLGTMAPVRQVTLEVDNSRVTRPVRLPEDSIRQVLYNIVVNAIEASPPGGVVRIAAALLENAVEVLVADQGAGIPQELRSQIYEPFFTTKSARATGGLGLGLSISRGIVEAMQGTLDFESAAAQGTVFRIRIPTIELESELVHG